MRPFTSGKAALQGTSIKQSISSNPATMTSRWTSLINCARKQRCQPLFIVIIMFNSLQAKLTNVYKTC